MSDADLGLRENKLVARTAASGSLPERQEFFRGVAKPQDSFLDRASALLMAGRGWIAAASGRRRAAQFRTGNSLVVSVCPPALVLEDGNHEDVLAPILQERE